MEKVALSLLTSKLKDKELNGELEENPDFIPECTMELGPQFYVEHRIKQVFEDPVEVKNYSLELVAAQVTQLRSKHDDMLSKLTMQVTESEDQEPAAASKTSVQEEELGNMLNNLGFRLNDACLLSPGDQSRGSSPSSPRSSSGLLTPKSGSRNQSRNRSSPTAPLSPSDSRPSRRLNSVVKVSKSKSVQNFALALQKEVDPIDNVLDSDYLDKLQQKMAKPTIVAVMDQLSQNKMKEETNARAKSASARKVSKMAPKKKNKKASEDGDIVSPLSSQVRTKLASVQNFKDPSKSC